MTPLFEDNHIIIVRKEAGEIVQGDKTGDTPLSETIKAYLKEKYNKPGNVFCGVVHRIDRPVTGVVVFAKTSKALSRLNEMIKKGEMHKTYWALVEGNVRIMKDISSRGFCRTARPTRPVWCLKGLRAPNFPNLITKFWL